MCGGIVDVPEGVASGECPYCGSLTTFPRINAARLEQMYERAEHFRQINDFDKAIFAFEAIMREYPDEAEAYWGLVLSRFGIEYVEEKSTGKRIPTCHRVQSTSILSDSDYKTALKLSEGTSEHDLYEAEAHRIADIQKGILNISAKETPFDVFICYKENTEGGSRSEESFIGQEIYQRLTKVGFKVFFARETLKDKIGQQYEPYIFAALNSAKVMLAIGTSKERLNAVWVKNEWSRFLSLMRNDRTRALIPCFKNMQASDLPDELSMFQALDISQIGFLQDLIQGIKNITASSAKPDSVSSKAGQEQVDASPSAALLKRIKVFMDNGDFDRALENCEKAIDIDPENGEIYMCKLMSLSGIRNVEELYTKHCNPFGDYVKGKSEANAYKLFLKYADESLKNFYKTAQRYESVVSDMRRAKDSQVLEDVIRRFDALAGVKDADELKQQCLARLDEAAEKKTESFLEEIDAKLKELCKDKSYASLNDYLTIIDELEGMHCDFGDDKIKYCLNQIYNKLVDDLLLSTPEDFNKLLTYLDTKSQKWPEITDLRKKIKEAHDVNLKKGCFPTIIVIAVIVIIVLVAVFSGNF